MKRYDLIPLPGEFYKANLHCHTVLSDGRLTPQECKTAYQKEGYSILAITDHRQYRWHKELSDEKFLMIAGYEADLSEPFQEPSEFGSIKTYHINFYDMEPERREGTSFQTPMPDCGYRDITGINQFIRHMNQEGFIACYNHPYWSLQNYDDYKNLEGLFAMEIYNHGCELDGLYGYNPQSYDEMLRTGQRLFPVAADDNHNQTGESDPFWDSFGGYIMVKAESLEYKTVMRALKNGEFYFSMGPEFKEIYIEDGKLHIKTSPAAKIYVIQEGRNCYKKAAKRGETISEAEFDLTGEEGYLRIVCQDCEGRQGGTRAYFMDELKKFI